MRRSTPTAMRLTALVLGLSLGLAAVAGCGPSSDASDKDVATISVSHKFGTTKVPEGADRVVTVGWNDQDFVLALGVVPVATRAWFDEYNGFSWVREATDGKGVEALGGDGINFEAIAKEKPDVIFAIYETIDEKTYERLSSIAPTVIQSDEYKDEETPWDVQMRTVGKALGKDDEAGRLVDQVETKIDESVKAHPEFKDKVLVVDFGPEDGGHYLIGAGDPRRALFDALGFAAQDTVGDVSEEKLSLLDEDVLFVNGATEKQMLAAPAFSRLDVVKDGRALYTSFDSDLSGALSYSGPDALLYALDVLVPQLADAVDG